MATQSSPPVTLLVLGAGGDLTRRLLLPGLATLLSTERDRRVRVVGADRAELSAAEWTSRVEGAFAQVQAPKAVTGRVVKHTEYVRSDILDPDSLGALVEGCGDGPLVVFFALPPSVTTRCCALLADLRLPEVTRLALEKPFGTDLASARDLNALLHRVVPEERVFRIDHFLGVNTVLNLVGTRFANRIFQPVWSRDHIERVEIVYDEDLALEGRAGYYDGAGALRDMLQSHLLQVLALFAMESVTTLDSEEVQDQKAQVLRAVRPWGRSAARSARRARYTAGTIGRRKIPDYTSEEGVDPARKTETLAQMTVAVENNRWAGVPFVLRSGKGMGEPRKEIVVTFRDVAHLPGGFQGAEGPDRLVIGLKPGSMELSMTMNAEGDPFDLEQKTLSATLAPPRMHAYGEVLGQILDGERLLSVRGDSAEECWRIVAPVLRAFAQDKVPMEEYPAGSSGPDGWLPSA
ncbi:glucose-6-phosphate dehydrogenase [Phycicoccus sp. CSK15P-2]|uniref:glucose-6-phosphate dehydrogenase n=1 Tax=Phycicoccus sp. CSK15P-2 TaxID=2807627 RepID=UPI0019509E99|nr:glucose-6-phosphate dehydrogenase [Phycicoccus sp. CSK15P-2]MBM6405909.1 glucose-6-phosphate dehydrogenase [Phycicoccus sp. CSK15P-2]